MTNTLILPGPFHPTKFGLEVVWDELDGLQKRFADKYLKKSYKDRITMMAGSDCNYLSTALGKLAFGKTAYAGETTIFVALYTAAIDDTLLGNTANESAYTSYARLSLTNDTTRFAVGSGSTTYTDSWPSDATKQWPASTGGTSTVTYMGALNGNAGTSADKGMVWAQITNVTINNGDTPQLAQNAVTQTRD